MLVSLGGMPVPYKLFIGGSKVEDHAALSSVAAGATDPATARIYGTDGLQLTE
jgi:hypothetical protein